MKSLSKTLVLVPAFGKVALGLVSASLLSLCLFACGGKGDTGNENDPNAGSGSPFVSNGAAGSTMTIELQGGGNEIGVTRRVEFKVTALDPSGLPLSNIRLFCESESGIAIIEPSSGGVAFAHTSANGIMSGVLGGLAPGSFLLECRGPQGFNLVARKSFKVTGEIPEGFDGFPGAAGGNLGGGVLVEPPGQDVALVEVLFSSVTNTTPTRVADLDLVQDECNQNFPDPAGEEDSVPELFGPDNFHITITNNLDERIFINAVDIEAPSSLPNGSIGPNISVEQQLGGLVVLPNSQVEFVGPFTRTFFTNGFVSRKQYAGSSAHVPFGTINVSFTVSMRTANGRSLRGTQFATIRTSNFNNCGG